MQPETADETPAEAPPEHPIESPSPSGSRRTWYWSAPLARAWAPVAIWIGVIFSLSSDDFAAPETSRIIGPLLAWLFPEASDETLAYFHFLIRKAAHVTEYGILYLLARRPLRIRSPHWAVWQNTLAALALVLLVASYDEFHQSLSLQRTGTVYDVALDVSGGVLALLLSWCYTLARQGWRRDAHTSSPSSSEPQESTPT